MSIVKLHKTLIVASPDEVLSFQEGDALILRVKRNGTVENMESEIVTLGQGGMVVIAPSDLTPNGRDRVVIDYTNIHSAEHLKKV